MALRITKKLMKLFGYVPQSELSAIPYDIAMDKEFMAIYEKCKPYTMTSVERMYGLYNAIKYVLNNSIEGDLVECGVWKGGSSMLMALTLLQSNTRDRRILLFDTFEGMSEPTENDRSFMGESAGELLGSQDKFSDESIWCYSSIDEVKKNLMSTGYPIDKISFVKGKVEDTLELNRPECICLLRLDTDWYESTKVELEQLFPNLKDGGVLIIDDFGHWEGAKKAVVEYFKKYNIRQFLSRLDYTGRLMIKSKS